MYDVLDILSAPPYPHQPQGVFPDHGVRVVHGEVDDGFEDRTVIDPEQIADHPPAHIGIAVAQPSDTVLHGKKTPPEQISYRLPPHPGIGVGGGFQKYIRIMVFVVEQDIVYRRGCRFIRALENGGDELSGAGGILENSLGCHFLDFRVVVLEITQDLFQVYPFQENLHYALGLSIKGKASRSQEHQKNV